MRSALHLHLVLAVLLTGVPGLLRGDPPPSPAAEAPTPTASPSATPPLAVPLGEIVPSAQSALNTLKSIQPDDAPDQPTAAVRASIWDLSRSIDQLRDRSAKATSTSLEVLRDLQDSWRRMQSTIKEKSEVVGGRGKALDGEAAQIRTLRARWQATDIEARKPDANVPVETLKLVSDVLDNAKAAEQRLGARRKTNLELQNTLGELVGRSQSGQNLVDVAQNNAVKTLFDRDAAPIWQREAQLRTDLVGHWRAAWQEQTALLGEYVVERKDLLATHFGIFVVLLAAVLWMRRGVHGLTEDEPYLKRAAPIFDVPIATALALSFVVKGPIYDGAPILFRSLIRALALLPTIVMLRRLLDKRLSLVLYSLVGFYAFDQVRGALAAYPAVARVAFCVELAVATGIFILLLRIQKTADASRRVELGKWMPFVSRVAILVLAAALAATLLGYVRFGAMLGNAALTSSYLAVFLYAVLRVIEGLTFILLRVRPLNAFHIAHKHREQVQTNVYRAFRFFAVVIWIDYTLVLLQLRDPLFNFAAAILERPIALGSISISLGKLLSFIAAIWLSVWISRLVRFFLDEEVYERVQLSPGLPYAISTILNYAVLLVGFLVALGLLGVDLTKITIVAGAFSVGLGFGLQNVINNFVSGVILLFERPIKVGDVVQLGDAVGEVRRIGIRASIIRTRDGSDLIVPNGNLISNQVTNWTYADRSRAVEIPFNVAAGADPAHLLAVLKQTADARPGAAGRPPSQVFITGIAANGLSVVVRSWTMHYEDWVEVKSDLVAALLNTLAREDIKLV